MRKSMILDQTGKNRMPGHREPAGESDFFPDQEKQVFFVHKSDAEILKKENGRGECRIVEGCSDIPT